MPPANCAVFGCTESSSKDRRTSLDQPDSNRTVSSTVPSTSTSDSVPFHIAALFNAAETFEAPLFKSCDLKYHSIPTGEVGLKWKVAGGRDPSAYTKNATICSKHFEKSQYNLELLQKRQYKCEGIRILKQDAVPSLHLPKTRTPTQSQVSRKRRMESKRYMLYKIISVINTHIKFKT